MTEDGSVSSKDEGTRRGELELGRVGDLRLASGEPERRRENDLELGNERRPLLIRDNLLGLMGSRQIEQGRKGA